MSLKTTHPSAKRRNKDRSKAAMQVVSQVEQVVAPPSGPACVLQPTTSANPDTSRYKLAFVMFFAAFKHFLGAV